MKMSAFLKKIDSYKTNLSCRENTMLGHQKQAVYMCFSLILIVGIICNLIGMTGPGSTYFVWLNSIHLIIAVLVLAGYSFRCLSLTVALCTITVVTQLEISAEMIYCAVNPNDYHYMLIVGNMVLLGVLIMFALVAYLKYFPYLLGIVSIGTYALCVFITKNPLLLNFLLLFLLVFIVICLLGHRMVKIFCHLGSENEMLRREEEELLRFLNTNKEEIGTLIALSHNDVANWEKTGSLLDSLHEERRRAIWENVSAYRLHKETEMRVIDETFSNLTQSEKDICQLILQGKKLTEICSILGKTETNINSTRAHIRKKLGLQPSDNLYRELLQRQKDYIERKNELPVQ